jgi:hypothetical protein
MKRNSLAFLVIAALSILAADSTSASVITDIATGAVPQTTATYPLGVISGDFTYLGNPAAPIGGDGTDDGVFWSFNFTGDPDYAAFSGPILQANFTITLIPRDSLVSSDAFTIIGLPLSVVPDIPPLSLNVPHTLTFDLLDFYSSAAILGALSGGGGVLQFQYNDDAHVTFAQLDLVSAPEPATIVLVGMGFFALALRKRLA